MVSATSQGKSGPNYYVMLCVVLSLTGWIPLITSRPMIHGGTFFDTLLTFTGIAFGGYATLEIIRDVKSLWAKIVWGLWLLPYGFAVVAGLYMAVPYIPRLFAG
jgi:hypothetical protein